ncbi:hypothetical protein [Aquipseudomonas alcaligenes]|uniref:hypothetical protein n=1 Tax=Aquipseudomonas alcaligenes TaxID=43263 RepID=UPI00117A79A5|nr:hypothetical protein [Pseudomonas alcaligenes]
MASITLVIAIIFIKLLLIHGGVFFLEKEKASARKAVLVIFILFLTSNAANFIRIELPTALSWAFSIIAVAITVHLIFKLKKINTLSLSAFYVVALIPIQIALAKIPPQFFMPAQS